MDVWLYFREDGKAAGVFTSLEAAAEAARADGVRAVDLDALIELWELQS